MAGQISSLTEIRAGSHTLYYQITADDAYNIISRNLTGLTADQNYVVICYTESLLSHVMEVDDANSLQVSVTTDCCRDVVFTITTSTIYEYSSRRRRQLQLPESSDIDRVHHALVALAV